MDGAVLTLRGKPFQIRGAATLNALYAIIVLVLGSVSNSLSDERNDLIGSVCDQFVKNSRFSKGTHFVSHN